MRLFVPLWSKRKNWPNWIARHESKTPPKLRLIDSDKHDDFVRLAVEKELKHRERVVKIANFQQPS